MPGVLCAPPYRVAGVDTYIRSARGTTRVKEVEGIEESLALVVANGCRRAADGATVAWHRRADELGMKAAAAGRVSLCRPCLSILCLGSCDDRRAANCGARYCRAAAIQA